MKRYLIERDIARIAPIEDAAGALAGLWEPERDGRLDE